MAHSFLPSRISC